MPWFRWLKKATTEGTAADAVSPPPAPADAPASPPETEPEIDAAPTADQAADAERPKRRRGSRGGRGRKKPGAAEREGDAASTTDTASTTDADGSRPTAKRSTKEKDKEPAEKKETSRRRSTTSGGQRRKQPPRRAPLPAAKRELVISVDVGEQRVAILEDDKVAEVYLERPERRSIAGNIYLGVVDNVLPGMEAAFVEIGLEKNGFLYVDEIVVPELEGKRHGKKIQDLISRGEKLLVQAVKDPMKTKGARLTTEISLPGRFLVFVPNGEGLGVSRRLEEAERTRLKEILRPIAPAEGGVIVRTAAEGASAEDVERDLVFLQRLWKTIQGRAKSATAPELVYQEAELPLRIVRDLFAGDFVAAYVDSERVHKRIVSYLKKTSPHMIERVHRWKEKEPVFAHFGVDQEIGSTLERRVDLPSGGYLIFDYAEAFTVIDVNTGRFVGSRSKSSTQRLEDTIVKNNLEAVKEVVRQLRLRDIGGIIVIDFIDMANAKNRQAVEDALRTELERDRTKTYVVEISPLGLVEMTRQNVTEGPREVMTRKCPTCDGDGIVVSDQTMAMDVERRLRGLAAAGAGSRVQGYRVAVHPRTLTLLAGPGGSRLAALEESTRRRFFLVEATGHVHGDHLEVLAEGRLDDLRPSAAIAEGAEVEVKLVEVGLHDATAGVGKIDGVDLVVADAAKLVGKKATVRVGRVLEGQAFALLIAADAPPIPITFESEAEKPTRAPARRKAVEEGGPEIDAAATTPAAEDAESPDETAPEAAAEPSLGEAASDEVDAAETDQDGASTEEGERPKKRTRRGSRGGKRRKKRPADEAGGAEAEAAAGAHEAETSEPLAEAPADGGGARTAEDAGQAEQASADRPARQRTRRTPKIHVPASGDASEPTPPDASGPTEPEPESESEAAAAADDGPPAAEGADGAPAKKRTRRGSRGGRGRRKKVVTAGEVGNGDGTEAAAADVPEGPDAAIEPAPDPASADAPPEDGARAPRAPRRAAAKPRSTAPVASVDEGAGDAGEAPVAAPAVDGAADGGYVPMSEWLDDFERAGREDR